MAAIASASSVAVSRPASILLLGWIGAIKATGASLATVALVDATRGLGLGPTMQTVAASVGTLALAATVIPTGLLADRIGRRRLLGWSYATAGGGSLISLLAPSAWIYVVGLALAGIGFGAMFSSSYAYVKAVAPGGGLGWALGLFSTYCSVVAAVSSVAGGALAGITWRLVFLVVPVMCAVAWVATPRLLPVMPPVPGGAVDARGLVLLGAALVCLLLGISQSARGAAPAPLALLAAGALLLTAWVIVEGRADEPSFPVRLFASGAFVGAALAGLVINIVQSVGTLQLSDFWQYLGDHTLLVVTLGLQPFYLIGIVGALLAGRALSRGVPPRQVLVWSCLLGAVGFLCFVPLDRHAAYAAFLPAIALVGIAMMAGGTAQSQVFVEQAPDTSYGVVTSSRTTVGQLGFALGLALSSVLADWLTSGGITRRLEAAGDSESAVRQGLDRVESYVQSGRAPGGAQGQLLLADAADSYHLAFRVLMIVCAVLLLACAAAVWVLMRTRATRPAGTAGSGAPPAHQA